VAGSKRSQAALDGHDAPVGRRDQGGVIGLGLVGVQPGERVISGTQPSCGID
jgi:hypothetical protein